MPEHALVSVARRCPGKDRIVESGLQSFPSAFFARRQHARVVRRDDTDESLRADFSTLGRHKYRDKVTSINLCMAGIWCGLSSDGRRRNNTLVRPVWTLVNEYLLMARSKAATSTEPRGGIRDHSELQGHHVNLYLRLYSDKPAIICFRAYK